MTLTFDPVSADRQHDYRQYLKKFAWKASDYSFINLRGWGKEYGLQWAWTDELVWIRQTEPDTAYWAPAGAWQKQDWNALLPRYFPSGTVFNRIPEELLKIWKETLGEKIAYEAREEHWDYLYSVEELIQLKGNRFHKKKNLFRQFCRKYAYEYVPLESKLIRQALDMQEDWCIWRDCESAEVLAAENRAIARVLEDWNELENIMGGALYVNGEMVAFTVAEETDSQTLLIHFEKGLPDYKGIYQAINRMFLEENAHYSIVNREQDLGDPGLRKAKKSYNPTDYVRKYRVCLK